MAESANFLFNDHGESATFADAKCLDDLIRDHYLSESDKVLSELIIINDLTSNRIKGNSRNRSESGQ